MKYGILAASAVIAALASSLSLKAAALNGDPYIHDPATVTACDGKWYTYGTGGGGIMSDDGWTWHTGPQRPGGGAAPDVIKIGNRYLMVYGATGGGLGGGHNGRILSMWNDTLDQQSPNYKWSQATVVASSDGNEDCDAIDPSLMIDADQRLWLSYGTFFGFVRVVELDPKTGLRVEGNQAVNIAIDCEGTELVYRDGWYYLFGTHGTCCNGATSTYNIQVGRSKKVTGPYLDNMGVDMIKGGGKMVAAAEGRFIGAGHFGRIVEADGVEKWSCHYEADLDRSGRSVLDVRPLHWLDGWPIAGENIQKETTFKIASANGGVGLHPAGTAPVSDWTVTPMPDAGGYLGMPYMKITQAGGSALAIDAGKQLVTVPAYTGAPEQLWRLDQLTDGSWRIIPKTADTKDALALTSAGGATTLTAYDFKNAAQHWNLTDPAASNLVKEGTYEIQSARSGFSLELAVDATPIGGGRGGFGGGGRGGRGGRGGGGPGGPGGPGGAPGGPGAAPGQGRQGAALPNDNATFLTAFGGGGGPGGPGGGGPGGGGGGGPVTPVQVPDVADVSKNWPTGDIGLRISDYMLAAHQKWTITPVPGGNANAPYYKIVIAGTDRALAATADKELTAVPHFSGKPEELWRIEKLDGGACRITPQQIPGSAEELVLTAIGGSTPTLAKFDPMSDKSRWNLRTP